MYEYKINLEEKDYVTFNEYHMQNSPSGKKTILTFRLMMPIISIIIIFIFWIVGVDPFLLLIESIVLALVSVFFVFYSKRLLMKSIVKTIAKLKKEGKLPYNQESVMTFDDEGIHEKTDKSESKNRYTMVEKIGNTDHAIYIYFSAMQAYIIPISVFESDTDKKQFLEFLYSKCTPKS